MLFSVVALAAPAIGIVTASGHFNVEGSQVWGNATLFDGTTIETSSASSELALRNGVKVQLAAGSRARIWQNRLVLEKGAARLAAPASFEAHVFNSANLIRAPYRGISMQAAQGQLVHDGCMVYKNGHFLVQDQTTQEVVEVSGTGLAANVGNRVEVRGSGSSTPGAAPATSAMNVSSVALVTQGGCLSVAAALDAKAEAPANSGNAAKAAATGAAAGAAAGAATGLSTGAIVGIVAGVGGGGAAAAFAVAHGKSSTSQ
ncbi:MAG: hypothetical protein ACRD4E_13175 [Bryobacteraceae bacterium]